MITNKIVVQTILALLPKHCQKNVFNLLTTTFGNSKFEQCFFLSAINIAILNGIEYYKYIKIHTQSASYFLFC